MNHSGFVAELGVRDVAQTLDFYERILNCVVVGTTEDEQGSLTWAEVDLLGSRLMFERIDLLAQELSGSHHLDGCSIRNVIVARVPSLADAQEILSKVTKNEVALVRNPTTTDYGAFEFGFVDPDGFVIVVACHDD